MLRNIKGKIKDFGLGKGVMLGGRRARRALLACILLLCSAYEMDAFSVPAIQFSAWPQGRCKSFGTRSHHWSRTTQCLRGPGLRGSATGVTSKREEDAEAASEPFISKLIKLASLTVDESYKIMDGG